ncbi:MAG: hypothetical protein E4H33_02230 [Anaerolineales bacterium]|nr:MAG: hypothetical protein E4H33_02230 [Anaerolineales bacterium]
MHTTIKSNHKNINRRTNLGIGLTIAGFLIFILGANPGLVNLDRSPIIGFVQTAIFSIGLAMICLGGFISFKTCQRSDRVQSLSQDIGFRLVATGYLISLISCMADVFGCGTQSWPAMPFFGPTQATGVVAGEILIAVGFLLYMPFFTSRS